MKDGYFIGLMSGTSLDGVDAAIVNFNTGFNLIETHFVPYPKALKLALLTLQHPSDNELEVTAMLGNTLATLYASAVKEILNKAKIDSTQISAIGCHGQTIRHQPIINGEIGFSLQIGNASLLSELTNITVVSDFRSRDIAAGGQGAPLVPAFHQALFASERQNRAIINIGGIANITYLPKTSDTSTSPVFGFDSGPGNMLLDAWIQQHLGVDYDQNGAWASSGKLITPLLEKMLTEPFFSVPIPKSTGRDLFHTEWLNHQLQNNMFNEADVACTLVHLTAHSIADALKVNCIDTTEIYLCGGGAHNQLLVNLLSQQITEKLPSTMKVKMTNDLNIDVDWVEAIAFAWLAKKCINRETANLPSVTGAAGARILGTITQS
jgi:anhydro-N-acetylmuramic acid kinase